MRITRNCVMIGIRILCLMGLLGWAVVSAHAQWVTQTISLKPGWNAIYLEVQPDPGECDAVFAGLPVESVWRFNRRKASIQFIQDPGELIVSQPDWLTWVPASSPLADQVSLFFLEGGRSYLVKLADNAPGVTWSVKGKPVLRSIEWLADSYNLAGLPLRPTNPPSYRMFIAHSSSLDTNIYRLQGNGTWARILNLDSTLMQSGESFWIRTKGLPGYSGPLKLRTDRRTGLEFGRILTEQTIRIVNDSTNSTTVSLRQLSSEAPPASSATALLGKVALGYWGNDFANGRAGWTNFPASLQSNLAPQGVWELRIEVRRRDMSPLGPFLTATSALYQSVLEITDSANRGRILAPVTAEGLQDLPNGPGAFSPAGAEPTHARAGLWIGSATVTNVNQPASTSPNLPVPTASEFSFRLLVHVSSTGQPRLLQKVLQMYKGGTYKPAGDGTTNRVVDQPGRFVLVADDRLIPQFSGVAVRDTAKVGRRFSSAAFGFRQPIEMSGTGDYGTTGARWACNVVVDYRDPLNPFVHRYHPDHDNLDDRYEQDLPEGHESFTVIRQVELEFSADDPDNLVLGGWRDTQLGGIYRETITGLHKRSLQVTGTFRLHHASRVGVLNDGL